MEHFKNIGIIGRLGSTKVIETVKHLKQFLADNHYHVVIEERTASILPGHNCQVSSKRLIGEICDCVIVIGGDGSVLGAARDLAKYDTPMLGVNRGNLGFLTDIKPSELEDKVGQVLSGRYVEEERFLLDAEVVRKGEVVGDGAALNDVVLHPGKSTRMIEFELFIEGQFVYSQKSDGLIVSTPTGSTAYALSGGGPIMHPTLDAVVMVPMFPHTLSSRPIVIGGNNEIKLVIAEDLETYPQISCDGQIHIPLAPGDTIYIRKKPHKLKVIHPISHDFYDACRTKLGWSHRLTEPAAKVITDSRQAE